MPARSADCSVMPVHIPSGCSPHPTHEVVAEFPLIEVSRDSFSRWSHRLRFRGRRSRETWTSKQCNPWTGFLRRKGSTYWLNSGSSFRFRLERIEGSRNIN
ncbi:uncharacterized protein LOC110828391 [Zootermopsis nevadensis]|uniref:uncharacterized protein LOC110828391 n=1 Tax=Zootermopsis nevadensis TaxID=136037 RepID=UPI000B8E55A6|nr:uncharacterized protein LOC110828391 [Zootermopsis nevadensis]